MTSFFVPGEDLLFEVDKLVLQVQGDEQVLGEDLLFKG